MDSERRPAEDLQLLPHFCRLCPTHHFRTEYLQHPAGCAGPATVLVAGDDLHRHQHSSAPCLTWVVPGQWSSRQVSDLRLDRIRYVDAGCDDVQFRRHRQRYRGADSHHSGHRRHPGDRPSGDLDCRRSKHCGAVRRVYLAISQTTFSYDFFQAGVFGAIYFTASLSIQSLSTRIRQNDIRALTQAVELADLERLNRQIIQRMRTGIIVVDPNDVVRMHNQSARALIGTGADDDLQKLPAPLQQVSERMARRQHTPLTAVPCQPGHT